MQALLQRVERGELDTSSALLEEAVQYSAYRHWWAAARGALDVLRTRNVAIGSEVRQAVTTLRDEAGSVLNLMRQTKMDEATINCAVMWAQGESSVNLLIKFAARLDAPVTVLNVDNEKVELGNDTLTFEATGRQKPKTFKLNLTFHGAILAERSTWSFASVGRMSFTIAKAVNETWPRLLQGKAKPKNMYSWYERQTALDAEVKAEGKVKKDQAEADKKVAAEKDKATKAAAEKTNPNIKPTPPLPGEPPSAPPPVDAPATPSDPPAPKKKKAKKPAKPAKAKDEV